LRNGIGQINVIGIPFKKAEQHPRKHKTTQKDCSNSESLRRQQSNGRLPEGVLIFFPSHEWVFRVKFTTDEVDPLPF
jgi:hypothetical protein